MMTWNDFYQRKHAIAAVVEHAGEHPDEPLNPDAIPAAHAIFDNAEQLLCALQYTWTQALTGRIGAALAEAEEDPHGDHVEAVRSAWLRAAEDNPVLRRVLDAHAHVHASSEEPARAFAREHRMIALAAGLAEHSEPTAKIARVGSALLQLLRLPHDEHSRRAERTRTPLPSA